MNWIKSKPVVETQRVAPEVTLSAFENHWLQAMAEMKENGDAENALAVVNHLTKMISLFGYARYEDPDQKCKNFWVENKCVERALSWLHDVKNKGLILPKEEDARLVIMLHSLCELAARDGAVIGYLNGNESRGISFNGACSLASLLIEYSVENEITLGETARHSFILLIKLAKRYPGLEHCLSHEVGIGYSNLVISGLSACFAQLPTYTKGNSEQMRPFIQQLKFVDDICHSAPPEMANAIAVCFKSSFLETVMKPALIQSVYEDEAVVTFYLQTMCDLITHPVLIQNILYFIISMLSVFLERMNHPNVSISVSTLGLFNSMLSFYCEDFWFHTILKYLLPQTHRMVSQRNTRLSDIDFQDSSVRFLSLLPQAVIEAVNPEILSQDYLQYLSSESRHLTALESVGFNFLSSAAESLAHNSEDAITNRVYPQWKLKYDGTDDLDFQKYMNRANQHLSGAHDRDRDQDFSKFAMKGNGQLPNAKTENNTAQVKTDRNESSADAKFTTIPLQPSQSTDEESSTPESEYDPLSVNSLKTDDGDTKSVPRDFPNSSISGATSSEGYSSFNTHESTDVTKFQHSDKQASFGPFLDCLLHHLTNWMTLDPDVLLFVTDSLSLIARSRIPLVSSLILDPSLILQPSFSSVASILNRIKADLDQYFRNNANLIAEVWNSLMRERKISSSSMSSISSNVSSDNESVSSVTSIGDTLRNKLRGTTGRLGSFFNKHISSPTASLSPSNANDSSNSLQEVAYGQGYRYTNSPLASPANNPTIDPAARLMAKRAIFFSHWMLELAAISQQLSWKIQ